MAILLREAVESLLSSSSLLWITKAATTTSTISSSSTKTISEGGGVGSWSHNTLLSSPRSDNIVGNLMSYLTSSSSSLVSRTFRIFSSSSNSLIQHQEQSSIHSHLVPPSNINLLNYFPLSRQDLSIPLNVTDNREASESLQIVDSVLEYVGVCVCILTLLFYLVTLILLIRNRKNYFLSLWPSKAIALVGAIVHSFFGILVLLFQQPWWTEIKNTNAFYDSTSISNNIACRILEPFEFFGFVLATCSVLFILSHTLTPRKKTDTHYTKAMPKSSLSTTEDDHHELKDTRPKITRTTSVVDVIINEELKRDLTENNRQLTGVTIDDGSVKPLRRSNSTSRNIVTSNTERGHTRRKSESNSHKSSETSSNKEEPIEICSTTVREPRQSFIKSAASALSVQEFQRTHLTINVTKENTRIFIRTLILTSMFSILQIASVIVDVVLSYNIQHHGLEFIYSHVTRYAGYCAFPLSSLLVYISFYFSFFITFNFYSVKLYRKLINKRLKRRVLTCQIIITSLFIIFGIFGKSGEVLFTIIQSINVKPTTLLYDVLVRFFNVVNFIGGDVLICFVIILYFVFIPLLETLETEKFYQARNSTSSTKQRPNSVSIVSSPTKLLIRQHIAPADNQDNRV